MVEQAIGESAVLLEPGRQRTPLQRMLRRYWVATRNFLIILLSGLAARYAGMDVINFGFGASLAGFILISIQPNHSRLARVFQFLFGYWFLWVLFHDARSFADSTPWVGTVHDWVWRLERAMFGGELLNARLQRIFFASGQVRAFDYALSAIYFSFFFVSLIVGGFMAWKKWRLARHVMIAKAFMLTIGFVIIFALPTTPPWLTPDSALHPGMNGPERVYRVTALVRGQDEGYHFSADNNALAAMPSIHMSTTMLVLFIAWGYRRRWRILAGLYVALMGFAIVYLGEHYILDEIAGIALALGSWKAAYLWSEQWEPVVLRRFRSLSNPILRRKRLSVTG